LYIGIALIAAGIILKIAMIRRSFMCLTASWWRTSYWPQCGCISFSRRFCWWHHRTPQLRFEGASMILS
jgi:hypothetical protein